MPGPIVMVAVVLIDCTLLSLSAPPRACTYLAIISSTFWAERQGASAAKAIMHRYTFLIIRNLLRFREHSSAASYCTPSLAGGNVQVSYTRETHVQFRVFCRPFSGKMISSRFTAFPQSCAKIARGYNLVPQLETSHKRWDIRCSRLLELEERHKAYEVASPILGFYGRILKFQSSI